MPLKLETFTTTRDTPFGDPVTEAAEETRLAAYDAGYSAGWEDATAAQSDDRARAEAEVARHLQTLHFSVQEARTHVLRSLEPLLMEVAARLLPEIAREALAPVVLEALMPMAEEFADAPVALRLNPAVREPVVRLVAQATGLTLRIIEDAAMPEGQVTIAVGEQEARVDLDAACATITGALRAFFDISVREQADAG